MEKPYYIGSLYLETGLYDDAIRELKAALKAKPGYTKAMYQKGAVLYDQRKFDEAAAMFEAEFRINPNDPNAHLALGHCLSMLGKSAEANAHYAEYSRLSEKK